MNGIKRFVQDNPETVLNACVCVCAAVVDSPGMAVGCFISHELNFNSSLQEHVTRAVGRIWKRFFYPKADGAQQPSLGRETSVVAVHPHSSTRDVVLFCGTSAFVVGLAALADVFKRCQYIQKMSFEYYIIPSFKQVEECDWDRRSIVLCTSVVALQGATLLFCRAKITALKRNLDRQGTTTRGLISQIGVHGTTIRTNTVAVRSLTSSTGALAAAVGDLKGGLSTTMRRVDSLETETRALKQRCRENYQKLEGEVSALFDELYSNVGIQTILDDPEIIAKLSRSQKKKDNALREQEYIRQRPRLKKYYHAMNQRFTGEYIACLIIRSGWVAPNQLQNPDDFVREALGVLPLPGIGIVTSIIGAVQGGRKQRMINHLCRSFGSDLATDLKYFERLARYLTIYQQEALAHPPPLDFAHTVFHTAKDAVLADDGSDPIVHKARKDCKTIFQKLLEQQLTIDADPATVLAILFESPP